MKRYEQKIKSFAEIAKLLASHSTSSRLKVGCIALKSDFSKIASFGYNGSYSGAPINPETGTEEDSLESGKSGFIHAEINMIAKFSESDPQNYIIILTHSPCIMCTKVLVNAGFKRVYWIDEYRETSHLQIFKERNILHGDISQLIHDYNLIRPNIY